MVDWHEDSFNANTHKNLEEHCHSIVIDKDEKVVVAKGQGVEELEETELDESIDEIQQTPPGKESNLGVVVLTIYICDIIVGNEFIDLGASVNLIPMTVAQSTGELKIEPTMITLLMGDKKSMKPMGIIKNFMIKINKI